MQQVLRLFGVPRLIDTAAEAQTWHLRCGSVHVTHTGYPTCCTAFDYWLEDWALASPGDFDCCCFQGYVAHWFPKPGTCVTLQHSETCRLELCQMVVLCKVTVNNGQTHLDAVSWYLTWCLCYASFSTMWVKLTLVRCVPRRACNVLSALANPPACRTVL